MLPASNETIMHTNSPSHTSEQLAEIVELMLWTGQLLLEYGADSNRIERNVTRIGKALGCEDIHIFISHNSIMITTAVENGFRTKIRRVKKHAINMTIISGISRMSWKVLNKELDREAVRSELHRIANIPSHYPRWLVIVMVGAACASFSQLFGGTWLIAGITFISASVAMFVRQELNLRHYNVFLIILASASTASILAGGLSLLTNAADPSIALASSVLLLVPGVPMINSIKDMVDGYTMVGLTRAINGVIISLCIALGLLLAMAALGIQNL